MVSNETNGSTQSPRELQVYSCSTVKAHGKPGPKIWVPVAQSKEREHAGRCQTHLDNCNHLEMTSNLGCWDDLHFSKRAEMSFLIRRQKKERRYIRVIMTWGLSFKKKEPQLQYI